jgi:putative nucleotidyltransferase with HDIG domain
MSQGTSSTSVQESGLSAAAWLLVVTVTLTGLALVALGGLGWQERNLTAILLLAAVAMAAERADFNLYDNINVSLAFVPMFAIMILAGLPGLAVVVPLAVVASAAGIDRHSYKNAFNFGTLMIAGTASILVLDAFGTASEPDAWPAVLGIALVAALANYVVNSILVSIAVGLTGGTRLLSVWKEHCMWLWPHYLVLGGLGLAIAAAYTAMGLWGIVVFLAPPLMMRLSLKQYLDRTTKGVLELRETHADLQIAHKQVTTAMVKLDKAYDGTLRSLVAALDARDSETGGHSSRVADLTAAIAEEMGISRDTEEGRVIAWGALLHDVGKIAVPDAILRKPGKLDDEEWVQMRSHARAGFDIVKGVEFLAPAAEIVLAHHERFDGGGYPRGLAGEDVPLGARIFMIADTFDAITSKRPYKDAIPAEEALAEILRHSGTQFDPAAVRAFLRVYQARFVGSSQGSSLRPQLSESLKRAILEAAGLEKSS